MKDSNRNRKILDAQQSAQSDKNQRVSKYAAKVAAERAMFAKKEDKSDGR